MRQAWAEEWACRVGCVPLLSPEIARARLPSGGQCSGRGTRTLPDREVAELPRAAQWLPPRYAAPPVRRCRAAAALAEHGSHTSAGEIRLCMRYAWAEMKGRERARGPCGTCVAAIAHDQTWLVRPHRADHIREKVAVFVATPRPCKCRLVNDVVELRTESNRANPILLSWPILLSRRP